MDVITIGLFVEIAVGVIAVAALVWRQLNRVETTLSTRMLELCNTLSAMKIELASMHGKASMTDVALSTCQSARCEYHDALGQILTRIQDELRDVRPLIYARPPGNPE